MDTEIFAYFPGHEATVAAVADYMQRHNLTPADVLAAYDEWMADLLREMKPAGSVEFVSPALRAERRNSTAFPAHTPRSTLKKRHRAGDLAQLPHACPKCGGAVEMLQLCHISSPVWRTQLACAADGCAWHGKSKLPIDALIARGAARLNDNVTEG